MWLFLQRRESNKNKLSLFYWNSMPLMIFPKEGRTGHGHTHKFWYEIVISSPSPIPSPSSISPPLSSSSSSLDLMQEGSLCGLQSVDHPHRQGLHQQSQCSVTITLITIITIITLTSEPDSPWSIFVLESPRSETFIHRRSNKWNLKRRSTWGLRQMKETSFHFVTRLVS